MIAKKSTVFFIFLTSIIGAWLFYLKYSVVSIENRIRHAKRGIIEAKKDQHILKAEWKSLTSPDRIQRLALKHLNMRQTDPAKLKEFDPAIFHSEAGRYKRTKRLSELVSEIITKDSGRGSL